MTGDPKDPLDAKEGVAANEPADEAGPTESPPDGVSDPDPLPDVEPDLGPNEGEGDIDGTVWDMTTSKGADEEEDLAPEDLSPSEWHEPDFETPIDEDADGGNDQPGTDWSVEEESPVLDAEDWGALEDERQTLPPGRILVGWREFVSLPQLALNEVIVRFDTGVSESTIRGRVVGVQSGQVNLDLEGTTGDVPGSVNSDGVFVDLVVRIGEVPRTIRCRVVETTGNHVVVLGRDAMEGYVVVDVAMSFLHRR